MDGRWIYSDGGSGLLSTLVPITSSARVSSLSQIPRLHPVIPNVDIIRGSVCADPGDAGFTCANGTLLADLVSQEIHQCDESPQ
jgi:hypothetical protein